MFDSFIENRTENILNKRGFIIEEHGETVVSTIERRGLLMKAEYSLYEYMIYRNTTVPIYLVLVFVRSLWFEAVAEAVKS